MNKAYNRINWENYPSDSTPLNEDNLNKMDVAINEVDNRVISLDTTKLPVATAYTMVKDVAFDEKTGALEQLYLGGRNGITGSWSEKNSMAISWQNVQKIGQEVIIVDMGHSVRGKGKIF